MKSANINTRTSNNNNGLTYWAKNLLLFALHIGLWTLWTLLIRGSRPDDSDSYAYDAVTVVLLTETVKFILSIVFHFGPLDPNQWLQEATTITQQWNMGVYFAVPAFIYTLYNSLFFLNLVYFDPVSYRVLINMRILWSGVLFQIFFNKQLGARKWFALTLLMIGCAINQIGEGFTFETNLWYLFTITFQSFTSSFGGVYSEVLLKKDVEISLNVKNMYLYLFSMIFNSIFIIFFRPELLSTDTFLKGYSTITYVIVFVGALCGFSTALFLRHLNIIMKEYAHSGEMFMTAFLSYWLFGQELTPQLVASMLLVTVSVWQYNYKPPAPEPQQQQQQQEV